jgi:hypothetical protein
MIRGTGFLTRTGWRLRDPREVCRINARFIARWITGRLIPPLATSEFPNFRSRIFNKDVNLRKKRYRG